VLLFQPTFQVSLKPEVITGENEEDSGEHIFLKRNLKNVFSHFFFLSFISRQFIKKDLFQTDLCRMEQYFLMFLLIIEGATEKVLEFVKSVNPISNEKQSEAVFLVVCDASMKEL
jgi:hypothetical protein